MKKLYEELKNVNGIISISLENEAITIERKDGLTGNISEGETWEGEKFYNVYTSYNGYLVKNNNKSFDCVINIFEVY